MQLRSESCIRTPMQVYDDNTHVISIFYNPVQHDRTKHIKVDKHFKKEKFDMGVICTPYLPKAQFDRMIYKLAVENIFKIA